MEGKNYQLTYIYFSILVAILAAILDCNFVRLLLLRAKTNPWHWTYQNWLLICLCSWPI